MTERPGELVAAFAGLRVLVVGEAMLDSYLEGSSGRLCREAPVPVVAVGRRRELPGGAANTAANLAALGARPALLSVAGDDAAGHALRAALEACGVDVQGLALSPTRQTLAKQRVLAGTQLLLRFDEGSTHAVDALLERRLVEHLEALHPVVDAVVVSDYGYGILTPRVIRALARAQAAHERVLVVDAKTLTAYRHARVTAVKPNYEEALALLGTRAPRDAAERTAAVAAQGDRLLALTRSRIAAVTLDTDGALFFERGAPPYRTFARPSPPVRAAGAGDTFVSALALALAAGASVPAAAELASRAAGVVVGKDATAACTAEELAGALAGERKVLSREALAARLVVYRQQGRRIVFTNGCFDILHRGHITYLNQAKALGDVLVVGVNTDAGVARLKGRGRPINALEDRLEVLAALSAVDHLVAFDEDTPVALVGAIRPHVYVKGGDYTRERLPEAPLVEAHGGRVHLLPHVADRSTSTMIQRIRAAAGRLGGRETGRGREEGWRPELGDRAPGALRSA
jgi:D-beta-D-heptose 7-phosphate kinase/D-beta-D-heptose 1-phosphate adenosyltransferase